MPLEYALQFRGRFSEPSPWKIPRSFNARLTSELGVKFIPDQIIRASKRHPYGLNLMVVGEAGLGKTTFLVRLSRWGLLAHSDRGDSSPRGSAGKNSCPNRNKLCAEYSLQYQSQGTQQPLPAARVGQDRRHQADHIRYLSLNAKPHSPPTPLHYLQINND